MNCVQCGASCTPFPRATSRVCENCYEENVRRFMEPGGGKLWWLSFASTAGFLGVAIIEAEGMGLAVQKARFLGCNPGGEVLGYAVTEDSVRDVPRHRLLSREELDKLGISTRPAGTGGKSTSSAP